MAILLNLVKSKKSQVFVGAHAVHLRRLLLIARQKCSRFKSVGAGEDTTLEDVIT